MKYQLPKDIRDDGVTSISVAGSQYAIDDDGCFEGPDIIAKDIEHMGIKGVAVEAKPVVEKPVAEALEPVNPEPGEVTEHTDTADDTAAFDPDTASYNDLGAFLNGKVDLIPQSKADRIEAARAALASPKTGAAV